MYGLHPAQYFAKKFNQFDFLVVTISFLSIAGDLHGSLGGDAINPVWIQVTRSVRMIRVLRAFSIFRLAGGLRKLVTTVMKSLPVSVDAGCFSVHCAP